MKPEKYPVLSGYLLERAVKCDISQNDILGCGNVRLVGQAPNPHWEEYEVKTSGPLRFGEPTQRSFPIMCRRSGARVLLLSTDKDLAQELIDKILSPGMPPGLLPVNIAVDRLVKDLSNTPTSYALSYAHARLPAFGVLLRSLSFYGDDLGESSFFKDNLKLMNFLSCGLRPTSSNSELVRLGSEGTVSFHFTSFKKTRLAQIEKVLTFLRLGGYLSATSYTGVMDNARTRLEE